MGSVGNGPTIQQALEYYQEDGYYINSILRKDPNDIYAQLDPKEKKYVELLDKATTKAVKHDTLYRIVDPSVVFGKLDDFDKDDLRAHILFGDDAYDKGAYSQGIKKKMEGIVNKAIGTEKPEKGFMSTTYDFDIAVHKVPEQTHSSGIGIILKIDNANKLKGAEINNTEKEVLLKRNYKYRFKKVYTVNYGGFPHIVVDTEVF